MANKNIPLRKCLGCNEMKAKQDLIRIIRTPEGNILFDEKGKANGRGAYICKNSQCLAKAMKSKALERSLKVSVPQNIFEELEKEMSTFG